jgi:DNA-binding NarL/FixJ family response regulator
VKSHVNNIYSKLDVNSRKEILNLNHNDKGWIQIIFMFNMDITMS